MRSMFAVCALASIGASAAAADAIEAIWLGHRSDSTETVTVSWKSTESGAGVVTYGATADLENKVPATGEGDLRRADIPLFPNGTYYQVKSGSAASAVHFINGYAQDELRIAVVGDLGFAKDGTWSAAVGREKPHLVLSAGDNVPALHQGTPVPPDTVEPFARLIASAPELFRTTPFLPILGNHDREIRPRGPRPPAVAVYDVSAKGFRRFFVLPGEEWRWHLDLPRHGLRLVAVDLNHVSDMGTTWQTCHAFAEDSEQLSWFVERMAESNAPYVVTLYNERYATVRNLANKAWGRVLARGSAAITGFGYFGERAEVDEKPYFNTAVSGTGAKYPDPASAAFFSTDNFLLLRVTKGGTRMIVEMKALSGETLDSRVVSPRIER
jgi:hypothetical protein